MYKVQLSQVNYKYGDNAYFPYSAGLIQSYVMNDMDLKKKVEFMPILFLRDPIESVISRLRGVRLLGLSCYIWNWNYNLKLAQKAKLEYPELIIVLGGPQVPQYNEDFLADHKFIDFLIDQEGEVAFAKLLKEILRESPEFKNVEGLRYRENGKEMRNAPAKRIENLDAIPSPYIEGVFDDLLLNHPLLQFQATQETHRGCPYSCTFCDWGSSTMTKVRRFGLDRLVQEFEWFGKKKIELLYNADANYGLFPEDVLLTNKMIEIKRKLGFPKKFRAAYAKNSNERVFEIAQILQNEDMCKGITLSFQSMDSTTLEFIKRRNMKVNNFRELITNYRQASIPTYTELIIGLPGESYSTFVQGVDTLLNSGQHDSLSVYHAMLLENAEMNRLEYKQLHGIKSQRIPLLLLHGTIEEDDVTEFYDVVTETNTMPREDWIKTSVFAWGIQAFHCLNLTQAISVGLKEAYAISYADFYETLFNHISNGSSYLSQLFKRLNKIARDVSDGKGSLDFEDRSFGNLMWPVEEILFLKAVSPEFWSIMSEFLEQSFPQVSIDDASDLISYQQISLKSKDPSKLTRIEMKSDWHSFISAALVNTPAKLTRKRTVVSRKSNLQYQTDADYAREVVWYGRKGSSLRDSSLILED